MIKLIEMIKVITINHVNMIRVSKVVKYNYIMSLLNWAHWLKEITLPNNQYDLEKCDKNDQNLIILLFS